MISSVVGWRGVVWPPEVAEFKERIKEYFKLRVLLSELRKF